MKKLKTLIGLLIIFVILFSNCTQIEMMKKFKSGAPLAGQEKSLVPFKLKGHKILVKVRLNNSKKDHQFLLDTGALTIVDKKTAEEFGIKKGANIPTMNKSEQAYLSELDSIALGGVKVQKFIVIVMDIQRVFGPALMVDGLIGSDFLRFFNVTIDHKNKKLILSQNIKNSPINMKKGQYLMDLKYTFPTRFPLVHLKISKDFEIDGIIDTGSPYSLVLPLSYADKFDDSTKKQLIKSTGLMAEWPSTTSNYNYLLRTDSIKIEGIKINDLPVIFAELPQSFKDKALIGKNFLDKYLTTIAYPNNKLLLRPIQNEKLQTNLFSAGLRLTKKPNKKTYVRGFWQGSPADNRDIQIGDEVVSINGCKTSELPIEQINRILNDDSIQKIVLEIKDKNKSRKVELRKRMLFPEE